MEGHELGRSYADGEIVVRQGEVGDCMFSLQEGRLEVLSIQPGRGEVRIGIMERGAIFGEMAILEKEVRSATVRALGEARVLTIDRKTFLRRVQEDPTIALNLLRTMSQRIRRLTARVGERRTTGERRKSHNPSAASDRRVGTDRRKTP